jgi:hypothetical protein
MTIGPLVWESLRHGYGRTWWEPWENLKLVRESFLLLWATMSGLALGGSSNYTKLPFIPCEEVILVLSKFALSFLFWIYFLDNSIVSTILLVFIVISSPPSPLPIIVARYFQPSHLIQEKIVKVSSNIYPFCEKWLSMTTRYKKVKTESYKS